MDIELILYIIFIVIALLTRVLRKKESNASGAPNQQEVVETSDSPSQTQPTFEDLLREFTGGKPAAKSLKEETRYPTSDTTSSYEDDYLADEEIKATYESSVRDAERFKTLDEQVDLQEPIMKFEHFRRYDQEEQYSLASEILESLHDQDGARKAIILSEIINRKYY